MSENRPNDGMQRNFSSMPTNHRAFTLLELVVVVAILGMIAATAAVQLRSTLATARLRSLTESVQNLDQLARRAARRRGQWVRMTFDLEHSHLLATGMGNWQSSIGEVNSDAAVRVSRVVTMEQQWTAGAADLLISPRGESKDFAVEFVAPNEHHWYVCLGMIGQWVELDDVEANDVGKVRRFLAARPDAD